MPTKGQVGTCIHQTQISLRIRAIWSDILMFAQWIDVVGEVDDDDVNTDDNDDYDGEERWRR